MTCGALVPAVYTTLLLSVTGREVEFEKGGRGEERRGRCSVRGYHFRSRATPTQCLPPWRACIIGPTRSLRESRAWRPQQQQQESTLRRLLLAAGPLRARRAGQCTQVNCARCSSACALSRDLLVHLPTPCTASAPPSGSAHRHSPRSPPLPALTERQHQHLGWAESSQQTQELLSHSVGLAPAAQVGGPAALQCSQGQESERGDGRVAMRTPTGPGKPWRRRLRHCRQLTPPPARLRRPWTRRPGSSWSSRAPRCPTCRCL